MPMTAPEGIDIKVTVGVSDVLERRRTVEFAANADQREEIAAFYCLPSVGHFAFEAELESLDGRTLRLRGRVSAQIVQTCVVSLEPVEQAIDEPFTVAFLLGRAEARAGDDPAVLVDPDGDDPPEPLSGGELDVGAIALEHFALAIDPYPRRPDAAELAPSASAGGGEASETEDSPFAVLRTLKPPKTP